MSLLAGKTGIVFGVANKRSIAWAIAQAWHAAGAKLAFTYQGERLKDNVTELVGAFGADTLILPCDVTKDEDIANDLGPKKIRVNCISAGPVNTLAARGIAGFQDMLKHYEAHAPLKRNVLPEELGATGAFLASDGAAAITGQVVYVDSGYQIMGM